MLPVAPDARRAFNRLPVPDKGDLFFDMEGDPLETGGLEYLFGLYFFENDLPVFKDFWAHDRQQEKKTFEIFIDYVYKHLSKHPDAHIYHYAHYEEAALKRLMFLHGTRERDVDDLLRNHKLLDLYKVVREGLRVSEPSYSIKNLENFYMDKRKAEVVNASESTVFYEKWKLTQDETCLDAIRDYNEEDCRSTYLLRNWLLSIKPTFAKSNGDGTSADSQESQQNFNTSDTILEYENLIDNPYRELLRLSTFLGNVTIRNENNLKQVRLKSSNTIRMPAERFKLIEKTLKVWRPQLKS